MSAQHNNLLISAAKGTVAPDSLGRLHVVSVCRTLPTPDDPTSGIFVANRLNALARLTSHQAIQPVPYFPALNPLPAWAMNRRRTLGRLSVEHTPMLYVPGVLKCIDAKWLARSVKRPLNALCRDWGVDVIDAHFGYPDGVGCVQVAKAEGIPVFVTIRGSETEFLQAPGLGGQLIRSWLVATGCICVSHELRRLVIERGVPSERVRVIHNAVDRSIFRPGSRERARHELGFDESVPLIVSVGHLVFRKRQHILVQALARLHADRPSAILAIIGGAAHDRNYPAELQRCIRDLNLTNHVRLLGRLQQSEVNAWLQAADVFALPTAREGCCNAVLEALAAGRPVVTTPVGDNSHFIRSGANGELIPVDDVAALAHALAGVISRPWDAERISRELDVGDWDDVASRVLEFFEERLEISGHDAQGRARGRAQVDRQ